MGETQDRRVRKPRQLIRQALFKLMLQKELREITVQEIADLADINRGTFYLHYKDIYDLYDQIKSEMLEEFFTIINKYPEKKHQGIMLPVLLDAFDFLAENADFCIAVLHNNDTVFLSRLLQGAKVLSLENWQAIRGTREDNLHDYFYSFITNGCVGLLSTWFQNGMKETPQQMAQLAERLIAYGIGASIIEPSGAEGQPERRKQDRRSGGK